MFKNISLIRCTHSWNILQHLKGNFVCPRLCYTLYLLHRIGDKKTELTTQNHQRNDKLLSEYSVPQSHILQCDCLQGSEILMIKKTTVQCLNVKKQLTWSSVARSQATPQHSSEKLVGMLRFFCCIQRGSCSCYDCDEDSPLLLTAKEKIFCQQEFEIIFTYNISPAMRPFKSTEISSRFSQGIIF